MSNLHLERTGVRHGVASNGRGGTLQFGPVDQEGAFTPGELLAIALAACNLMTADQVLTRRLGEDAGHASAEVTTVKDADDNRFTDAEVRITVDMADLDEAARQSLDEVMQRSVAKACTIGRTLEAGLPHTLTVVPR